MASRRAMREESWDSVHASELSPDYGDDEHSIEGDLYVARRRPKLMNIGDVHKAMYPLRTTADRVGKQVEKFSETLDRLARGNTQDKKDCRRVLPLVREYEDIAASTVKHLKSYHELERQENLKGIWKRKVQDIGRTPTPLEKNLGEKGLSKGTTTVKDLEAWEQERQTWHLLRLMLQLEYPIKDASQFLEEQDEEIQRPPSGLKTHRYSSENEVWESFLGDFDDVWEKHVVLEWLKCNAESTGQDIQSVIEELDQAADRGSGLFAHGWLYSKEAIKQQKRMRARPRPLDPGSPSVDSTLVNREGTKKLVTQLDPDAFSRQDRSIVTEDMSFEHAAWLGCWEMMRRGADWQTIQAFCRERVEGWRALSIRGDPRITTARGNNAGELGAQSRILWRKMCLEASKNGGIDDYERAVYGFLSGDFASVKTVVRSWDDYLFALYNSQLLSQFDYLISRTLSDRIPETGNNTYEKTFLNQVRPDNMSGKDAWQALLSNSGTKEEAGQPFKMLQGSLIAHSFEDYIHSQGLALGRSLTTAEREAKRLLRGTSQEPASGGPAANLSLEDYDMLRILTHVILLFLDMKAFKGISVATENIIFAYINYLGLAGKIDLVPIYASRLSELGSIECMARQLPTISQQSDQRLMMELMMEYNMNVVAILRQQLSLLALDSGEESDIDFPRLRMVNLTKPGTYDMHVIVSGFLNQEITRKHVDLVHAVEWYLYLEGEWQETMWAGTLVYQYFLRTGAFTAARLLSQTVTFSLICKEKTPRILGRLVDLSDDWRSRGNAEEDMKVEIMLRQADTFRGFENLMWALDALEEWKLAFDENQPIQSREGRDAIQSAYERVITDVAPILSPDWLGKPADDTEAASIVAVRAAHLPDIVIAYISALYFSGHCLSREILLKIMSLAIEIAAEGSQVQAVFVETKRMTQLMEALSVSSFGIARAEETMAKQRGAGKGKRGKPGPKGESLDIWKTKLLENRARRADD